MKMYCQNCGLGMSFSNAKPNFCSKCGKPLGSSLANETTTSDEQGQDEDDNQSLDFLSMNKLEVEIDDLQTPKQTLGNIIESQPEARPPQNFSDQFENLSTEPKQTNEEFLKEFQNEAGTSRPNG
jgi:hypothetical protein